MHNIPPSIKIAINELALEHARKHKSEKWPLSEESSNIFKTYIKGAEDMWFLVKKENLLKTSTTNI